MRLLLPTLCLLSAAAAAGCRDAQDHAVTTDPPATAPPAPAPVAGVVDQPAGRSATVDQAAGRSAPVDTPPAAAPAKRLADTAKLVIQGEPTQGGIVQAKIDARVKHISFPGHRTTIVDDGAFVIGFGRDAPAQETLRLTLEDGSVLEHVFDVVQRSYDTERIDNLPASQVELSPETRAEVARMGKKLDGIRARFTADDCFEGPFAWPVDGKITSHYGLPRVLDGEEAGPHWGVDIAAKVGTPVRAPACGHVVAVEEDAPLSGTVVVVAHGRGVSSTFLHLDKVKVKVGDKVKAGDVLATVGKTGRTTGPHLDWRMNVFDVRVDPELIAPPMKTRAR